MAESQSSQDTSCFDAVDQQVSQLCDQFADELRGGKQPSIEEYLVGRSACADRLRPALMAVQSLVLLGAVAPPPHRPFLQSPLPQPGDIIGDFQVVGVVSRGGMGIVYEAIQLSLQRVVALKVLALLEPFSELSSSSLIRFNNEMRAAASLQHPHIVPVHAIGSHEDLHFYAMQLIEGMDWRQWNRQMSQTGNRDWKIIAASVRDVALALHHAHERGVLHRDIKPSNLLRDNRGHSWVVDFGLASYPASVAATATGELVGTLRYLSPELFKPGSLRNDARSDIYSLGATFYEMLTGCPLISGEQQSDQLCALVNENYKLPSQVSRDLPLPLETIVLKMIAREPTDRYLSALDVASDLQCWLLAKPIQARRLSRFQYGLRWSRLHVGWMLTLILFMAISLVMLGLLSTQLFKTRNELSEQLLVSHAAVAQARTTSGSFGQRFAALQSIAEATEDGMFPSMSEPMQELFKRTAATALSLIDAQEQWVLPRPHGGSLDSIVFRRDLRYSTLSEGTKVQVVRVGDGKVVSEFVLESEPLTMCFVDQCLLVLRGPESASTVEVWNWQEKKCLWSLPATRFSATPRRFAIAASQETSAVAIGLTNGEVWILDRASGERLATLAAEATQPIGQVQFTPDGTLLAVTHVAPDNKIVVWDALQWKIQATWSTDNDAFSVAWSLDGSRLAVGSGYDVIVFETERLFETPLATLGGPQEIIANICFHPSNRWLAVYGYDGKTRLWDLDNRKIELVLEGHSHCFNPNGNQLAFRTYDGMGIWQLGLDDVVWHQRNIHGIEKNFEVCTFACGDKWLVVAGSRGMQIWNYPTRSLLIDISDHQFYDLAWLPAKRQLIVVSEMGLSLLTEAELQSKMASKPVAHLPPISFETLQPQRLAFPEDELPQRLSVSADGNQLAATTESGGLVWLSDRKPWIWLARPGENYCYVSVSADGSYLASSAKNSPLTSVWQLTSTPSIWPIDSPEGGAVCWGLIEHQWHLITSEQHRYRHWQMTTAGPKHVLDVPRPSGYQKSVVAWTNQLLALAMDSTLVRLSDPLSRKPLLDLVDGYQTKRTLDMSISSESRKLAIALGQEGFLVWDLDVLRREFTKLGMPLGH